MYKAFLCLLLMVMCGENLHSRNISYVLPESQEEIMKVIEVLDSLSLADDDKQYINLLNQLLESPQVPVEEKERIRFQLASALKNKVGAKASDFTFEMKDKTTNTLYNISSDYIILYFNDPSCSDCLAVKQQLATSGKINDLIDEGRLVILSVCVEGRTEDWENQILPANWIDSCDELLRITDREVYDLPTLPVLYLLNKNHSVLLKNTTVEKIENRIP